MSPEPAARPHGALLYLTFGIVLVAAVVWFVRAAPDTGDDPRVAGWRRSAVEQLPDVPLQAAADTMVMTGDAAAARSANVGGGSYDLSMICLGDGGQVRVRLSSAGQDSGRGVPCAEPPTEVTVTVALDAEFYLEVTGETQGTAVFRWRLDRARF